MFTLQIEHGIKDFGMWQGAYNADPLNRAASGVVAERISVPLDDNHYVVVDLDFTTARAAEDFLARLHGEVWNSATSSPALAGGPKTRIVEQLSAKGISQ